MTALLSDHAARERIRTDTAATLFVNAGAGSGKTTALAGRVKQLVLVDGVALSRIAAVTFTEKAGAELRDRLRAEFEREWRTDSAAERALDDLDGAAIGTLHAFAQRVLTEHPIEAGLPPIIEVLDEVGSSVAFEERWSELQAELLDDDGIAEPLLLGMALGMTLKHVRTLAFMLGKDWDLIEDRVLADPAAPVCLPDLEEFSLHAKAFIEVERHCLEPSDRLLPKVQDFARLVAEFQVANDEDAILGLLDLMGSAKFGNFGQKGNWAVPVSQIRDAGNALAAHARAAVGQVLDQCLRQVAEWVARRVLESAESRRRQGKLEFHDLLVLCRNMLRHHEDVRAALYEDYQRVLLDEFQDTDPIQIEIAARICGGAAAEAANWRDIAVPEGRLFIVGDAKQSIYRFRRASIATYLEAESHLGAPVGLTTNFRSVGPILDWINAVFALLIREVDGGQPNYVPLDCHRSDVGDGPAVTILGARAHTDLPRAAASLLREREAADVASCIRRALDERWQVYDDRRAAWRAVALSDIAVLVPARTSLPFLEDALDEAAIPYRAEASSLVYQAAEVRDLLACARAVADPSDALSLVTALRSPLFGCGDDDLWHWKHSGGYFSIFSELDDTQMMRGPVGSALNYLRALHFDSRWLAPSEVLSTIVADRRMLETAAVGPRARDSWRRVRFVVDQARAWSEVSHGGLRAYLAWAAHQGQEVSRVAEAVLPETDTDAVRVMTIHAAKGLEFPVVILSGMTAQPRRVGGVALLWPSTGGYQAKLSKSVQTGEFEAALPVDEQMDELERLRLLYVAATRARDHLVVSLHRDANGKSGTAAKVISDADGGSAAGARHFDGHPTLRVESLDRPAIAVPENYARWYAELTTARKNSETISAISASGLEGTEPEIVFATDGAPGAAKGARDIDLPPWSKGRYGSAIGRAVHAVLQGIDLLSGEGVASAAAAQAVAEGVVGQEPLIEALVRAALSSDIVRRAAAREHWRETYVGTRRPDGSVLEGYTDLVFREDDGSLVIVDYKTDAVPPDGIASRVAYYAPQMGAYREALGAATGLAVSGVLLFLNPSGAWHAHEL